MGKKEKDERFRKFGTVSFTGTTRVNDFIDHLEQGRVTGTRCETCNRAFFPPRADCCDCRTSRMAWFDVQGAGSLITYSTRPSVPGALKRICPTPSPWWILRTSRSSDALPAIFPKRRFPSA